MNQDLLFTAIRKSRMIHIEGDAGSGKTTLSYLIAGDYVLREAGWVTWIDCDHKFAPRRVKSLFPSDAQLVLSHILYVKTQSLKHLAISVNNLVSNQFPGLVVVDSISNHLRAAISECPKRRGIYINEFFDGILSPLVLNSRMTTSRVVLIHQQSYSPVREKTVKFLDQIFEGSEALRVRLAKPDPIWDDWGKKVGETKSRSVQVTKISEDLETGFQVSWDLAGSTFTFS